MRLLEEANNLKKLTNCQEDKIKRLATKLMRVTASTRPCSLALNIYEDKNKIIALELENSKVRVKFFFLIFTKKFKDIEIKINKRIEKKKE